MRKGIALILVLVCILGLVGCTSQAEKRLMADGPWGSQAIWADERDQIYLICTKGENDTVATVTAYMSFFVGWEALEFDLQKGAKKVFLSQDGKIIFETKIKMDGEKLILSEFSAPNGGNLPFKVNLELTKYDYNEMVDKLPFTLP